MHKLESEARAVASGRVLMVIEKVGLEVSFEMFLCHQAVQFGTSSRAAMYCGWEGIRRSNVTLAMRHNYGYMKITNSQNSRKP